MKIKKRNRDRLNKLDTILRNNSVKESTKRNLFYHELRYHLLDWLIPKIKELDYEDAEINSELFLFSCRLYKEYDQSKSSLVPYLESRMDWKIANLFSRRLNKRPPILKEPFYKDYSYEMDNEVYLSSPSSILFENRYLGKVFTSSLKCVIQELLEEDRLNYLNLSQKLGISSFLLKIKVEKIRSKLEEMYHNG
jgi:hypothetical protein